METENTTPTFKILMFPWLAHGHIFPFLELAKRILKIKKFHIYIFTTPINFSSIQKFIDKNLLHNSIELMEFHLEPFQELPPHYHTTKNLPSSLNPTLHKAFQSSKSRFSEMIKSLKPDLVIYDLLSPWAPRIASSQGIPAVYFSIFSAAIFAYVHHHYTTTCRTGPNGSRFPEELRLTESEEKSLGSMVDFLSVHVFQGDKDFAFLNFELSCEFVLFKTSLGLEGKCVHYISSERRKEVLAVGPLVSDPFEIDDDDEEENLKIMEWLSKKKECSTVYVSFGSECFLSEREIEEIAKGLEISGVNFIWVVRFPIEEERTVVSFEEVVPKGFLERVKDKGIIVKWAPQANILAHKSIGGFVSHCGWSSVMESLYFGVPIIALPMKIDQPLHARLVVAGGVGVEVRRGINGIFSREGVAKAINEVILEKGCEDLRDRVRKFSDEMRRGKEQEVDEVANRLLELCIKYKQKKLVEAIPSSST